jgi:hypothetical protein
MPDYTPAQLRAYIDDVDAVLRTAVADGTLREVFAAERSRIVSILLFYLVTNWSEIPLECSDDSDKGLPGCPGSHG